jgi:hypothetical protein
MAKKPSNNKGPTPVEAIKHKDSRINIPTEELRGSRKCNMRVGTAVNRLGCWRTVSADS